MTGENIARQYWMVVYRMTLKVRKMKRGGGGGGGPEELMVGDEKGRLL